MVSAKRINQEACESVDNFVRNYVEELGHAKLAAVRPKVHLSAIADRMGLNESQRTLHHHEIHKAFQKAWASMSLVFTARVWNKNRVLN